MVINATHIAMSVRNSRSLSVEDVIFVIRRDPVKVSRLKEFLSWKDLRKNARPGEETGTNLAAAGDAEDDILGLAQIEGISIGANAADGGEGVAVASRPSKPAKRKQAKLPWDLIAGLVVEATAGEVDLLEEEPIDLEVSAESTRRLVAADRLTRDMTREEYMEYSECRQASFTYKKAKKFRDWINPAQYVDMRLNDDVVEILGFLAWEMVRKLTESALEVKTQQTREREAMSGAPQLAVEDVGCALFKSPMEKTAITLENIHEAVQRIDRESPNPARILLPNPLYRRRICLY